MRMASRGRSAYHRAMATFSMRFHWKRGEPEPPRAGPFDLLALEAAGALVEATHRWETQPYKQGPKGYRVFSKDDGSLVYQHDRRN
jgi:hypothetical protein